MTLTQIFQIFLYLQLLRLDLAWALTNKASELCRAQGYQHVDTQQRELRHREQLLFWFVYAIDKRLTLCLGRTSTIQDWDVTIPPPETHASDSQNPSLYFLPVTVKLSACHGEIYELFSRLSSHCVADDVRFAHTSTLKDRLGALEREISWTSVGYRCC
jgi:hypothetical protein